MFHSIFFESWISFQQNLRLQHRQYCNCWLLFEICREDDEPPQKKLAAAASKAAASKPKSKAKAKANTKKDKAEPAEKKEKEIPEDSDQKTPPSKPGKTDPPSACMKRPAAKSTSTNSLWPQSATATSHHHFSNTVDADSKNYNNTVVHVEPTIIMTLWKYVPRCQKKQEGGSRRKQSQCWQGFVLRETEQVWLQTWWTRSQRFLSEIHDTVQNPWGKVFKPVLFERVARLIAIFFPASISAACRLVVSTWTQRSSAKPLPIAEFLF